jgi:hypothetical protein
MYIGTQYGNFMIIFGCQFSFLCLFCVGNMSLYTVYGMSVGREIWNLIHFQDNMT